MIYSDEPENRHGPFASIAEAESTILGWADKYDNGLKVSIYREILEKEAIIQVETELTAKFVALI